MNTRRRKLLRILVGSAAGLCAAWLSGVRLFAFHGDSMVPVVRPGDTFVGLVGLWGLRAPERFDMVIFDLPPESKWAARKIPWMKRVVGLPGERVRVSGAHLFINGQRMDAPFLRSERPEKTGADREIRLERDQYFVVGDNLDHSLEDSRSMGPISRSLVKGFVAFVIRTSPAAEGRAMSAPTEP